MSLTFEDVISPIPLEQFATEFLNKKPLFIPGHPEKFKDLGSLNDFLALLAPKFDDTSCKMSSLSPSFDCSLNTGLVDEPFIEASNMTLPGLWNGGCNFCATDTQTPELVGLVKSIPSPIKNPIDLRSECGRAYVTSYGAHRGHVVGCHVDSQSVILMQLVGEKTWTIDETPTYPGVVEPVGAEQFKEESIDYAGLSALLDPLGQTRENILIPAKSVTYKLGPGDCLYFPPGTFHEATTGDMSFHYSLTFEPVDAFALIKLEISKLKQTQKLFRKDFRFDPGLVKQLQEAFAAWLESLNR